MLWQAVLSLFLFAAVLNGSYLSAYTWRQGHTAHLRAFSLLCLCTVLYLFGYLMEVNSQELEWLIFWNQIQYLGLPFFAPLWLLVCIHYTGRVRNVTSRVLAVLFLVPGVVFVARLTNGLHHLYYTEYSLLERGTLVLLGLGKGPFYWLQAASITVALALGGVLYLRSARRHAGDIRYWIPVGASVVAYTGYLLNQRYAAGTGLDYGALTLPLALLVMTLGLFRYDVLSARSTARDDLFEQSRDAMILLDRQGDVMDHNRMARSLFPRLASPPDFLSADALLAGEPELLQVLSDREKRDLSRAGENGERVWEGAATDVRDRRGHRLGCLLTLRDVTDRRRQEEELRRSEEKMRQLATRDMLSGLPNRFSFMKEGQLRLARARTAGEPLCLLMIDIDHFKRINDTYGHATGDRVVESIGERIRERFRKSDIAGRLGGDEFGVLLGGIDAGEARAVAEEFRRSFAGEVPRILKDGPPVTLSIGIAQLRGEDEDLDVLMERADRALYQAKQAGRDRSVVWEAGPEGSVLGKTT